MLNVYVGIWGKCLKDLLSSKDNISSYSSICGLLQYPTRFCTERTWSDLERISTIYLSELVDGSYFYEAKPSFILLASNIRFISLHSAFS